jgi:hypothetical protein
MNLTDLLLELYSRKAKCEEAIALVESLQQMTGRRVSSTTFNGKSRGRKSMGMDERRQVSDRMKAYWAKRNRGDSSLASTLDQQTTHL